MKVPDIVIKLGDLCEKLADKVLLSYIRQTQVAIYTSRIPLLYRAFNFKEYNNYKKKVKQCIIDKVAPPELDKYDYTVHFGQKKGDARPYVPNFLYKFIYRSNSRFKAKDIQLILRFCSTLTSTGRFTDLDAFKILSKSNALSPYARKVCGDISVYLLQGYNIAEIITNHYENNFPLNMSAILDIGITSHNLPLMYTKLADKMQNSAKIKKELKKVSLYPMIILCLSLGLIIGTKMYFIPQMKDFTDNFQLTGSLAVIDMLGTILITPTYLVLAVAVVFGIHFVIKHNRGLTTLKQMIWLNVPKIREFIVIANLRDFFDEMQLLLDPKAGRLNESDALPKALPTIENVVIRKHLSDIYANCIANGGQRFDILSNDCIYYDDTVKAMIQVGVKANTLPSEMNDISVLMNERLQDTIDMLQQLITPLTLVLVGGLVASIFVPMFTQMYNVSV